MGIVVVAIVVLNLLVCTEVGKDPDVAERVAFEVVRSVTGAAVEHYDTAGRQGAVDGLIHYPDGTAALEVTMLTDPVSRQIEKLLSDDDFKWTCPSGRWRWTLEIKPGARLRDVRGRVCEVIAWCEANGVRNPQVRAYARHLPGAGEVVRWLESSHVELFGHPDVTDRPGEIMVVPDTKGGAAGNMALVVPWLDGELQTDRTGRKVDKLAAAEQSRGELFLIVDDSGAPFAGFYAMAFGEGVPDGEPHAPAALDSIWLAPRWSPVVLRWARRCGWSRHTPYDDPQQLTNP